MKKGILNIGFDNLVLTRRIAGIIQAETKSIKRSIDAARRTNKLIDATSGRKTQVLSQMDSATKVLSALETQTLSEGIKP